MKKVTYFDVEYANSKNKSLCQIGLLCENFETGDALVDSKMVYHNEGCQKSHKYKDKKNITRFVF